MGVLDKIKDSVSFIGNEPLGEIKAKKIKKEKEPKNEEPKKIKFEKKKKKPKPVLKEEIPEIKEEIEEDYTEKENNSFFKRTKKFKEILKESKVPELSKDDSFQRYNKQILSVLNISENYDIDSLKDIEEFENVVFDGVSPYGADIPQVERFVDKAINEIRKLHYILETRQEDFEKLLNEASHLQAKLVAKQHDEQLTNSIIASKEKEQELKEQVLALSLENKRLKQELANQPHPFSDLPPLPSAPKDRHNKLPDLF